LPIALEHRILLNNTDSSISISCSWNKDIVSINHKFTIPRNTPWMSSISVHIHGLARVELSIGAQITRVIMPKELNSLFACVVEGKENSLIPRSGSFTSLCLSGYHWHRSVIDHILAQIFITIETSGELSKFTCFWLEVLFSFLSGIGLDCIGSKAKEAKRCEIESLHVECCVGSVSCLF